MKIYPDAKGVPGTTVIRIAATRHVETIVLLSHKNVDGFISVKMEYEDGVDRLPEQLLME